MGRRRREEVGKEEGEAAERESFPLALPNIILHILSRGRTDPSGCFYISRNLLETEVLSADKDFS